MSNYSKERDQAEELRRLVYDVQSNQGENAEYIQHDKHLKTEKREIDILNLPPRKEVHAKKQHRVRLKTSNSFKRFLLVIIILIIVLGSIFYFFNEELIQFFSS
ncbi:hypothetical protein ACDX78_10950 [Virgibacillus oceani]